MENKRQLMLACHDAIKGRRLAEVTGDAGRAGHAG